MAHFDIHIENNVATIWIDQPKTEVNTLSVDLLSEFKQLLDNIEGNDDIKAAVLISRKTECFIAGADIKAFAKMKSSEQAEKLSREGNQLLLRLEKLKKPVIAAINGACLGGGLEVAMACHYRIATKHPKTVFGLPEVKLGLLPGGGGTQRIIQLCGLRFGLDALLTGKNIYPHSAKKNGLIDALIHPEGLYQAALQVASQWKKQPERKNSFIDKALSTAFGRGLVMNKAREKVKRTTRGNYPAPLKIIECVETGLEHDFKAGLEAESEAFAQLHATEVSKNLIQLFLSIQENKKLKSNNKTETINHIGVIGAGFMGSGIVEVSIKNGYQITLKDVSEQSLAKALKTIWLNFTARVKKKAMKAVERDRLLSQIKITVDDSDLKNAELIVEAVFEDITLKQKILQNMEQQCKKTTIFATNTSSLPLSDISAKASNPKNIIGMHYFSPVPKMPLLELIVTEQTSKRAQKIATNVGIKQGKTVVVVNDSPGFYTTRILSAMTHEAIEVLHDGASVEQIDSAMRDWGFPIGPLALLDEVGLDVANHIADGALGTLFEKRGIKKDQTIKKITQAKLYGRKSGEGFYSYPKKGKKSVNAGIYQYFGGDERKNMAKSDIQNRIGLIFVNECILCLQEGVIKTPADGDLAAILGLGFPPFTGGPFKYVDEVGADNVLAILKSYQKEYGQRFMPANLLEEQASDHKTFH